jgi:hypothetical protein
MTTQREIRQAFWLTFYVDGCPREYRGKTQNDLPADVRQAFVEFVDYLAREGTISETLAARVTL